MINSVLRQVLTSYTRLKRPSFRLFSFMSFEKGKKAAAERAVIDHVKDNYVIGIGSGTTIVYAVKKIAELIKNSEINVKCVPTSFQAKQMIIESGLPLVTLEEHPILDLAIDGADEVDSSLIAIKGGGGCLLQEKIVDYAARTFICVCDSRKNVNTLGTFWKKGIPIEVIPMAYRGVQMEINMILGGTSYLRMAEKKMGPVITDQGNFIIDWVFDSQHQWDLVDQKLHMIPGVVETGLFIDVIKKSYFGDEHGNVEVR